MIEKAPRTAVRELDSLPDLVLIIEFATALIVDVNEHAARGLGYSREEIIGRPVSEFSDALSDEQNVALYVNVMQGETVHFDTRIRHANGDWWSFNCAARRVTGSTEQLVVTGRHMEALAHSNSQLAGLLKLADLTEDIFVVSDNSGIITYANAAAARVHGATEFVGRHLSEFVHEDDVGFQGLVEAVLAREGRAEGRVLGKRADGSPIMFGVRTIYDKESEHWFTVERDISATIAQEREMERLATDLRRQATTDTLTGVANRYALNEALDEAVGLGETFALLLLDMDDFKSVNDTLGHAAGDEFLRCVAQRMQHAVKLTDMVARLGGDEFVVYLPGVDADEASLVADRMIRAVGQDFSISGTSILRSCSIGLAIWEGGESVSDVLRKADRAAYRAKHEGRSRYVVY